MRKSFITLLALAAASPALAQHEGHDMNPMEEQQPAAADPHAGHDMGQQPPETPSADPHAGHDMSGEAEPENPPPWPASDAARSGPPHAADAIFGTSEMAAARKQMVAESGSMTTHKIIADRLEYRAQDGKDGYIWDVQAWYGGDIDKLWLKSEGEGDFGESPESIEVQALWSHAIGPFFDLQAGVRYDFRPDPERAYLVAGVQGLTPYKFELDAAAFLSDEGDLSARIEAEYDQRITQSLILQPRVEASFSAQDVPEFGIGSGLSSLEAGLRLRYEFAPQFAPYIGVEWERKIGDTADFARLAGEEAETTRMVVGIRAWF